MVLKLSVLPREHYPVLSVSLAQGFVTDGVKLIPPDVELCLVGAGENVDLFTKVPKTWDDIASFLDDKVKTWRAREKLMCYALGLFAQG